MSRSRKKNPFCKIAGGSDKLDRSLANRKFRRLAKIKIKTSTDLPMKLKEVSDTWSFSSDGLAYRIRCASSKKEEDKMFVKRLMRK